jgi:ABC-type nitrate/sulfonate/bicarbonate transport system substrate-binding protein
MPKRDLTLPRRMRGATLALLLGVGSATGCLAQTPLAVSYFPGSGTGPIFAGIEQGFFAKEGLAVTAEATNGSVAQITAMLDGRYQIGFGGLDDVIAYDVGQGEVPIKQKADLFAFMGTDSGSLHLVTAPDVKSIEDLKGRTLAVDAKTTGFAFVLYRMAALHGLKPGDYDVLSVGSSQKRLEALTQGHAQAAVVFKPVADLLAIKGFHDLMPITDVFPHYQAAAVLARRSWATAHRRALVGFISGYIAATRWFLDPANKDAAIALLLKYMPGLAPQAAAGTYGAAAAIADPHGAIGRIDPAGVATAVALREAYGEPKRKLGDPHRFYDLHYYRAALDVAHHAAH